MGVEVNIMFFIYRIKSTNFLGILEMPTRNVKVRNEMCVVKQNLYIIQRSDQAKYIKVLNDKDLL